MTLDSDTVEQNAQAYSQAWSSKSPEGVASFYAVEGQIVINRGDPIKGQTAIAEMVTGFYEAFPDLIVKCDKVRTAADHVIFIWTLEGHHVETKNMVRIGGWEEWELDEKMKIKSSLGWYDANEYERQIAEGI